MYRLKSCGVICIQKYRISFSTLYCTDIQDLKIAKGLALGDILTEVHTIIQRGICIFILLFNQFVPSPRK